MSIHRRETSKGVHDDVHLRDENGRQCQRTFRTTLDIYTKATDEADRKAAKALAKRFVRPWPDAAGHDTATDVG